MKKISKILALILALVMAFGVLSACSGSSSDTSSETGTSTDTTTSGETDTTLTIGLMVAPSTHDPMATNDRKRFQSRTIFNSLLNIDPETGDLVYTLVDSVEYVDDLTLEIKLRDDVYFTNGQNLTAKDVFYTYKDVYGVGQMASYFECYDWDASSIVDDYTIDFVFTKPYGPAITLLASYDVYCYDDLWGDNALSADDWMTAPNGTGPYYCVENVASAYATYKVKEDYWGETPECTEVTFKYYSEAATMYIDFEAGNLDVACAISETDAQRVLNGEAPDFAGYYMNPIKDCLLLVLPEYVEAFNDERVREAVSLAVDQDAIATAGFGCLKLDATSILPSTVNFYEEQEGYTVDLDRAKELMAEAGYGDGLDLTLVITQDNQTIAEALQACLANIGINLSIESYDPGTAIPMMMAGETDLCLKQAEGGAFTGDPCQLVDTLGPNSTLGAARITDTTWAEAFDKALYSSDDADRADGYATMQEWARETNRIIPICERANMTVYNKDKLASFVLACADEPCAQYAKFN
jgi:peptide/nickel transport system substrate-binding protein